MSMIPRLLHRLARDRLALERRRSASDGRHAEKRILAVASWSFPVYSQTFVNQELSSLIRAGFDLRLIYARAEPKDRIAPRFHDLWQRRRRLISNPGIHLADYRYFARRYPRRVEALLEELRASSHLSRDQLLNHQHVLRGFSFARFAAAFRPHYLHSYFFYEGTLFTWVASQLLDIPRGVSCYADHLLDDSELKLVPLHLRSSELVIATSQRIRDELVSIAPEAEPRILVKPNAIDVSHFPYQRRTEPKPGEPFRLLCVNRIEPKKGLADAVEALAELRNRELAAELHILGEPDHGNPDSEACDRDLKSTIHRLGLGDVVHLEGRQNDAGIRRHLARAHVFVAPYVETRDGDKDGIPTALLEAMATGLPAAATRAGSIAEVIEDGDDGVLVDERNPRQLAAALVDLLRSPERRERLGQQASAKIASRFDIEVCEPAFHDRLTRILESRAS